ncbi:MAG: hypothetical protein ACYTFM_11195 [Planctomycetota bacterium]
MQRCQKYLTILICLSILAFTIPSNAEEEIEDLIDIFESNSKIIAIIEGKKTMSFNLQADEKVLWSGSIGYLGAFLTSDRFFVISTSSATWKYLHLKSDEPEQAIASLSPNIALLVTGDRAIVYHAASNRFIVTHLPIHDELVAAKAEKYVAVVITSSRAFGFAAKSSTFVSISFLGRETTQEIKISSSKATVRTSDRLLTFEASGSTWNEHRLF